MTGPSTVVILFSIATAVAIAVRRIQIPYTIALVVVGLVLGATHLVDAPHLTRDFLFAVFLPGLLFEAAFNIEYGHFRQNSFAITALALPGVIAAILITALIVTGLFDVTGLAPGFTFNDGLVLGALFAATDPIAVVGIFRKMRMPPRLLLLLEGESLFNDGTAIVFYTLILRYVTGVNVTMTSLFVGLVVITGGGIALGLAVGAIAAFITRRIDDPMIEIAVTMIAAYGSFALAESFQVSGVIATVTAGMMCGNLGQKAPTSPPTRIAVSAFWEYVAFALNSLIFLLIGFEVSAVSLATSAREISIAYVAMQIARLGIIVLVIVALRRTSERIPMRWGAPLSWGGLRGALSMVLALSVPPSLPQRPLLVTMTFGVVILSILVQGLSIAPMLRRLRIERRDG
jgi:CPA1 family monovalent cation:H+ antiporter